ncbi:MAG: DUF87 domain-containing protein [Aquificaceae bacterium]|nr:DUF87 domain-containing protein [Aquificaceae bacterium]MDW8422941.1 DUF87 domain-containing protein [Aquificaceae bacterium]
MKEFFELLRDRVSKAKESLKVASPWIDACFLESLLERLPKSVKVEVILRAEDFKDLSITGMETFSLVEKYQIDLYLSQRLHAKLFLVDGTFALVGSANLTRPGMGEGGNLEAMVYLEGEKVKELEKLFEEFKGQSVKILKETVAVVVSLQSSTELEALLLEEIPEQSFFWAQKEGNKILCRLTRIYTQGLNVEGAWGNKPWTIAHLMVQSTKSLQLGKVKVLLELKGSKEGYFGTPLKPLTPGDQLLPVAEEDKDLQKVMKTNLSGYSMDVPVRVGSLPGKGVDVFVDLAKLTSTHMAVLGTTGSGKTTFVRRLLENMPKDSAKVLIFDLFGEYFQKLNLEEDWVYHVSIPYTLLPIWIEDIREILRDYGFVLQERSEEEKSFLAQIRSHIKPDIKLSKYKEKSLWEIILEASKGGLRRDVMELLDMLSKDMGQQALMNQPEVFRLLEDALHSNKQVVIINLKEVVSLFTRLNLVGLLLREIFSLARQIPERRLVVLEEAHNFAPERGATEVPAGRENLAINMTRRIALEGRKFDLGLLAISQRPANISKYVLSQLNTQAIFRLITQNDIDAVSQFFDYPYEDQLRLLPTLKPGHLFLSGIGVPFSMLVEIEL